MSGYTPGPWRVSSPVTDPNAYDIESECGTKITRGYYGTSACADARLISAAPELLRACREAIECSLTDTDCCCYCGRDIKTCEAEIGCPMHTCRLAIAKAEVK